jgi:hypothetical protein
MLAFISVRTRGLLVGTYGIVEKEHDGCGVPSPLLAPEEHLADVTNIPDFRMTQTELP